MSLWGEVGGGLSCCVVVWLVRGASHEFDEAAFLALRGRGLTFKVGEGPTAAQGRLKDVEEVLAYLQTYLRPTSL
mgnify:CR=1 FL=1